MALDETLLFFTSKKESPPTLRLYAWNPPTLSIGYAQKSGDVDLKAIADYGWNFVRRPTGGKAILHTNEITYSITAPLDNPVVVGTLLESYQKISQALLEALVLLGVTADSTKMAGPTPTSISSNPVCFEVPSNYEITSKGKKLIGSAQARKSGGVLQHGSLPLIGDITRITSVLRYNSEEERIADVQKLLAHATTVEMLEGKVISWQQAADALIQAISSALNIEFQPGNPTINELVMANDLEKSKYATDEWNFRL
jgi:lipoate-protein ligase A